MNHNIKQNHFFSVSLVCVLVFTFFLSWSAQATSITVSTTSDTIANDGFCSLREAVISANTNSLALPTSFGECAVGEGSATAIDVISVPAGTYCLTVTGSDESLSATGDLDIYSDITFVGAGEHETIIDAGCESPLGDRVFDVTVVGKTIEMSDLTIQGGSISSAASKYGAGIQVTTNTDLTLSHVTVTGNSLSTTAGSARGAGIYLGSGTETSNGINLILNQSTVSGNSTTATSSSEGAGIYAGSWATVTLTDTAVSGNTAVGTGSTVTGGGVYLKANTTGIFVNSTIANNFVSGASTVKGGGIYFEGTALTLFSDTLSGNTVASSAGAASGGGLYTTVNVFTKNTLLSGNSITSGSTRLGVDCLTSGAAAVRSYGYNFIGNETSSGDCLVSVIENPGTDLSAAHATLFLSALADNGGTTSTMALATDSPAVDTGSCVGMAESGYTGTLTTDQRGQTRDASCDRGSFEVICGDGVLGGTEACDDGNVVDEDGCSSVCVVEPGHVDADADGFSLDVDCDDNNASIYPGASEICNGEDDDCDTLIDDADTAVTGKSFWYADADSDGYGGASLFMEACAQPSGYFATVTDCDDGNANIHPLATEVCNGVDDDCDSLIDDADTGGVMGVSVWYADVDSDSFGDLSSTTPACTQPEGYVFNSTDCDDTAGAVNPSATEVCNEVDDDCDLEVDEGVTQIFYADTDSDGFGDPAVSQVVCAVPAGYVANATDCNDSAVLAYTGATEVCGDGVDNDCVDGDAVCPAVIACGNNLIETGETCDDGNTVDGDGCSSTCTVESPVLAAVCGNNVVETGEVCDDGNTTSGDGCDSACQTEEAGSGSDDTNGSSSSGGGCSLATKTPVACFSNSLLFVALACVLSIVRKKNGKAQNAL